jgi:signal transduction histidine kinase
MNRDATLSAVAVARLRQAGRLAAALALGIGLIEVAAVVAGFDALRAPIRGGPLFSGTAAVGFTLASLGLVVDTPSASSARRTLRDVLGAATFAVGFAAFVDNALDIWPGIGMPSMPASIALVLVGLATVLIDRSAWQGKRPSDVLGAFVGYIGLVTLLGHAHAAGQLYTGIDHGTALVGSISMCLLAGALLCARPAEGLVSVLATPTSGGVTARRLGLAAVVVVPGLGIAVALFQHALGLEERSVFAVVLATATTLSLAVIAATSSDLDRTDRRLARARAAEEALRQHIEALSRASETMSEAVARMDGSDVTPVLQAIAEQARLVAGAEYAAIGVTSGDDPVEFSALATAGVPASVLSALHGTAPRASGVLADVVLRGKPVRARLGHGAAIGRMPADHPPIRNLLGLPLVFGGVQLGSVLLGNKLGAEEFSEDDQKVVEMLAQRAASALRAAQMVEVEARAHQWLQTVIDQTPEPLLISDAEGHITKWNRAARIARGGPGGEHDGGSSAVLDLRLPTGEPVPESELPIAVALRRGEPVTGVELQLRTSDGTAIPVIASAAPLREPDGRIGGAIALFDDITTLKQLERMREEWTAVIAHDLRQPLNGIILHTQVLRRGLGDKASERQLESIDHIKIAGTRLNRMIEDLLDATRIEASRLKLVRQPLSLPALLRQLLGRMPELSGHDVAVEEAGEVPPVEVDAMRIEQVLSNLLSNAAKYGDGQGPIHVRIAHEGRETCVSVTNVGSELGEAELSRLFTRFYRTPSAQAGPKRGIGLGLYITKGLVQAHGGRIWVTSAQGRTTFHFTLPTGGGESSGSAGGGGEGKLQRDHGTLERIASGEARVA